MKKKFYLLVVLSCSQLVYGQTIEPDLQNAAQWNVVNRTATPLSDNGKKGVSLNEVANNGLMIFKGGDFSNGVIELDIKGSNKMQQSFVGFAFHGQDANTFDAIYFRPFNFKSDDAMRRSHSVQYISMPNYDILH